MSTPRYPIALAVLVGLLFLSLTTRGAAQAATLSVPGDYATIQGAVDNADPGDVVTVAAGTYNENIIITRPLVLSSGVAGGATVIAAKKEADTILVEGVTGELIISGLKVQGSETAAIRILKSKGATVTGNILSENVNGIFVDNSSEISVTENKAFSNEKGIYFYFTDNSVIEGNNADNNTFNGILLHASHKNLIEKNTTNANLWNGITLSSSNDNVITANTSVKNTYAIVIGESIGNVVSENTTARRLYFLLPVVLIYVAIFLYLVERKAFLIYYKVKYG